MCDLTNPAFKDEDKAREFLEKTRWPDGPVCPFCGQLETVKPLGGKSMGPGWYHCSECREKFTVRVGTLYERSHIALHKWLLATHLMVSSKKGMSAHQLHRMLGITYKSAWFMAHRIREAFKMPESGPIGGGGKIVEADETFWGNVKPYRHRAPGRRNAGWGHKNKILALVERDGASRTFHLANVDHQTLKPILQAQIAQDTHLMTDGASHYKEIGPDFLSHEAVNHAAGEYARKSRKVKGAVAHTNTVESFFGLLKRGLVGT